MSFSVVPFIDKDGNIVVEHRDGDKLLSHATFTADQALAFATDIINLAGMVACARDHPNYGKKPPDANPRSH